MTKATSCPICHKPSAEKYDPFCSKRCADVDLNRWLSEGYSVPGPEDESAHEDAQSPDSEPRLH